MRPSGSARPGWRLRRMPRPCAFFGPERHGACHPRLLGFPCVSHDGILRGYDARAQRVGVHLRKFGPKEDLRRVVHLDEENDEGPRGPIRRPDIALAQVEADREFPDREEQGGEGGPDPDITPGHLGVRENLNMRANKPVMIASERRSSSNCSTNSGAGSQPPNQVPTAETAAVNTSDTRSKKPVPSSAPTEMKRSRMTPQMPRPSFGATPQTEFRESWSWANTPDAPASRVTAAINVATTPVEGWLAR